MIGWWMLCSLININIQTGNKKNPVGFDEQAIQDQVYRKLAELSQLGDGWLINQGKPEMKRSGRIKQASN